MSERHVEIETADGTLPAFLALPDEGAQPAPPVIFYMDAPAIREELRDMARRIAAEGYVCLLPDLYYRIGTIRFDQDYLRTPDGSNPVMRAARNTLTNAMIIRDTDAMLRFLDSQPETLDGAVGAVGHCMSGRFVVSVAGAFPERFQAVASLYGVQIVTNESDSPHLLAGKIKAELYLAFAEHDEYVPENVVPTLADCLPAVGITHAIKTFNDTHHGFCFPSRPAYAEAAAEETWSEIFAMFERRLPRAA